MQVCGFRSSRSDSPVGDFALRGPMRRGARCLGNPLLVMRVVLQRKRGALWSSRKTVLVEALALVTQAQRCWDCSSQQSCKVISMSSLDVCLHRGFLCPYKESVCLLTPFSKFSICWIYYRGYVTCHKKTKEMLSLEKSYSFVIVSSAKTSMKGWKDKSL